MKEFQFQLRTLKITSVDIYLNLDYGDPFLEMRFSFEQRDANTGYSIEQTLKVDSESDTVKGIFEILKCQNANELAGCELSELRYRTLNSNGNWTVWNRAGYGNIASDDFIENLGNGTIMTRQKLENLLKKKYC